MARRIIILDSPAADSYRIALWADVPAARQPFYASAGAVSAWGGASVAENNAIASGAVVERVETIGVPPGESNAAVRARLQAKWAAFQAEITASNPWSRYGTFWDGATWTAAGVA